MELHNKIVELTETLLLAISKSDWSKYVELVDKDVSCFEPEASGYLVKGLEFHKYYFNYLKDLKSPPQNVTICSPHVRSLGPESALIAYVRLVQTLDESGKPVTKKYEETRIWQKIEGNWKNIHFHRTKLL